MNGFITHQLLWNLQLWSSNILCTNKKIFLNSKNSQYLIEYYPVLHLFFSSIASVSEHQPTSWSSFYFDLQVLTILFPAGLYYCFTRLTDHNIFIILYGVTSVYFAGVMVSVYYLVMALVPEITWVSSFGSAVETYVSEGQNQGRGNFWSSEWGTRQNRRGAQILSFIAFLCENFQNFPKVFPE